MRTVKHLEYYRVKRWKQAFNEHAPDILEPTEIEDENSTEEGLISGEAF